MQYTIGEISKRLDMQPSTLRYYDKEGLMPNVKRTNVKGFNPLSKQANQFNAECKAYKRRYPHF